MYEIYTDGSCLGNPGAGGWGAIGDDLKLCGASAKTTNNIMEMTADSNYVKNGITKWIINWKKNGWMTSTGTPVKNKELWIQIDTLREKVKMIEWRWVRAHNGHPQNEGNG